MPWEDSRFEIRPGSIEAQLEWASKTELTMAEDAVVESLLPELLWRFRVGGHRGSF